MDNGLSSAASDFLILSISDHTLDQPAALHVCKHLDSAPRFVSSFPQASSTSLANAAADVAAAVAANAMYDYAKNKQKRDEVSDPSHLHESQVSIQPVSTLISYYSSLSSSSIPSRNAGPNVSSSKSGPAETRHAFQSPPNRHTSLLLTAFASSFTLTSFQLPHTPPSMVMRFAAPSPGTVTALIAYPSCQPQQRSGSGTSTTTTSPRFIVAGLSTGRCCVWEASTGVMIASWSAHFRKITKILATTGQGAGMGWLITAAEDTQCYAWDWITILNTALSQAIRYVPVKKFLGHALPITDVQVGIGGARSRLFTTSLDRTIKIWHLASSDLITTVHFPAPTTGIAIHISERFFFAALSDGHIVRVAMDGLAQVASISIAAAGKGNKNSDTGNRQVANEPTQVGYTFRAHLSKVTAMVFSPCAQYLITASTDTSVSTWDVDTCTLVSKYERHLSAVSALHILWPAPVVHTYHDVSSCVEPSIPQLPFPSLSRTVIQADPETGVEDDSLFFVPRNSFSYHRGPSEDRDLTGASGMEDTLILSDRKRPYSAWHAFDRALFVISSLDTSRIHASKLPVAKMGRKSTVGVDVQGHTHNQSSRDQQGTSGIIHDIRSGVGVEGVIVDQASEGIIFQNPSQHQEQEGHKRESTRSEGLDEVQKVKTLALSLLDLITEQALSK